MADREFKVGIILDASGVIKGVEDADGAIVKFTKSLEDSKTALVETADDSTNLGDAQVEMAGKTEISHAAITALNQALEIGKKAYEAISGAISSTTEVYSIQEIAEQGVANALKLTNSFTETGLQGWKDWASELQNVTTTGDEATLELIKMSKALGLTDEQTKTLITASVDLSAVTGKGVKSSFKLLQGTYSGVATSLEKLGLNVKSLTVDQIKSGAGVDLVAEKFKGLAEAQTKTFTGASIQAANAFGDVLEEIGKLFVEVLDLTGRGHAMTQFWVEVGKAVGQVREAVLVAKDVMIGFIELPWSKLTTAASLMGGLAIAIVAVQIATGTANANMIAFILNIVRSGAAALTTGAQYALLAVKAGLIAAGVATVVIAVDLLVRNLDNLSGLADVVWNVFKKAFANMAGVVTSMIGEMGTALADFAKGAGLSGLGEALGSAAQSASNTAIEQFDIASGLQVKIDNLSKNIDTGFAGDIAKKLDDAFNSIKVPDIAAKAAGGGGGGGGGGGSFPVVGPAAAGGGAAVKEKEKEKAIVEKISEAQKNLNDLLKNQTGIQTTINEFGKSNAELLNLRLASRLQEIDAIGAAAGAQGSLAVAEAKSNEIELAKLKFAEMQKAVIDDLKDDVQSLNMNALNGVELAQEKLRIDLEALNLKEDELAKANMLTAEAEKLLDAKRKAIEAGSATDIKKIESDKAAAGDKPGSAAPSVSFINEAQLATIQDTFGATTTATVGAIGGAAAAFAGPVAAAGAIIGMASGIIDAVLNIPAKLAEVFNKLTDFGPNLANAIKDLLKSIVGMVSSLIPNLLQGLFDIIMSVLDMFATSLPDAFVSLANKIPEMLQKFIDAAPEMAQKLIQGLFKMNPTTLVTKFMVSIIKSLPKLITSLVDSIPLIINEFITGFMEGIDEMVTMFVDLFINGGVEKIIKAVIVALAEGVKKIFKGIFGGFKLPKLPPLEVPPALTELPAKLGNAVKNIATGIKAGGSDVFSVLDVSKVKSAKAIDKTIGDATRQATKTFENGFARIGKKLSSLWDKLREVWLWVWGLLSGLWEGIKMIFKIIVDALQILWDGIKAIWDVVVQALQLLWDGIEAIWDVVVQALQLLWDGLQAIWDVVILAVQALWDGLKVIWDAVVLALQGLWDSLKEIFAKVWEKFTEVIASLGEVFGKLWTFITEGAQKILDVIMKIPGLWIQGATAILNVITQIPGKIGEGVTNLTNAISSIPGKFAEGANTVLSKFGEIGEKVFTQLRDAFNKLNPANLLGKMFDVGPSQGKVEGLLGIDIPVIPFARGGIVPGTSPFSGDNKKNDTVAALLSPGEAVIPNSVMSDPNIARLVSSIMDGQVKFAYGGLKPPSIKISAPKISAPKLPSVNDIKKMNPADLIKSVTDNLEALKNMAFGDVWSLFKDEVFKQAQNSVMSLIKQGAGSFDNGGVVPGDGIGMLHQNEIVLPTNIIDKLMGIQKPSAAPVTNLTLNATIAIAGDGRATGKKVIDEMFVELRKRSANQKIMFQSGLIA